MIVDFFVALPRRHSQNHGATCCRANTGAGSYPEIEGLDENRSTVIPCT
jgi:hypothetical protein